MNRIVYLDGAWLAEAEAKVSIFDRGFLFADAVYEVTAVIGGKLIDYPAHLARLKRSLAELRIGLPLGDDDLLAVHRRIVATNRLDEGLVYLQVSRGPQERDFLVSAAPAPTVVLFTQQKSILANPMAERGLSVATVPEQRWARRDIKTVQLLSASLLKSEAHARGFDDVLLVEDGLVTEASSANISLVTPEGHLVTRGRGSAILPGITRASVLDLARGAGIATEERAFSPEEAKAAAEVFITSATSFVMPVVRIDGMPIGAGAPGPLTRMLRRLYVEDRTAGAL